MGRTAEAVGRKAHLCGGCGGTFSYWIRRTSVPEGSSDSEYEIARKEAEDEIVKGVDAHPCPYCGVVQPEMLAARQTNHFLAALLVGCAGIALGMFFAGGRLVTMQQGAWIAVGSALAAWWLALRAGSFRPNDDLEANLALARKELLNGKILRGEEGRPDAEPPPHVLRPRPHEYPYGVGLYLASAAAASAVSFAPLVMGWTQNDASIPAVAGPGEPVAIPFPNSTPWGARAVKSEATARIANAAALGLAAKDAVLFAEVYGTLERTKKDVGRWELLDWARTFGVELDLPRDPALAGKTLELDLTVSAVVKLSDGTEAAAVHRYAPTLTLSGPDAGRKYQKAFYGGLGASLALCGLGGGLLLAAAWGLKKSRAARSWLADREDPPPAVAKILARSAGAPSD